MKDLIQKVTGYSNPKKTGPNLKFIDKKYKTQCVCFKIKFQ